MMRSKKWAQTTKRAKLDKTKRRKSARSETRKTKTSNRMLPQLRMMLSHPLAMVNSKKRLR